MKKQIRITKNWVVLLVLTTVLTFTVSSCTEDFVSLNTPPHQISEGNIDVGLLGQSFAHAQFFGMYGSAGAFQLGQSLFGDLYSQYFATTAENFDSDQFVEVGRWINGAWRNFYGNGARSLSFVETFSAENEGLELPNAVAKIWRVQLYHRMTDYWGPVLYSQVGNGETSVPYDSQQDIYMDFFDTLDEAVATLNQNRGSSVFAGHDQVFDGNVDQWITFANSLRLRLAIRIRYADPGKAQTEAEKAVAAGVMMDNSQNAMLKTTDNSRNPYNVITNWGEFRMSSAMESILEGYNDPRTGVYFSPSVDGDSDGDGSPYEGMRNGLPRVQKGGVLNSQFSDMGSDWLPPNRGGTNPVIRIMGSSEVYLLRAEGAILGWNMGGSAKDLYEDGIRMSLTESRVGADMATIDAYIQGTSFPADPQDSWSSPPLSDIPVAFDVGGSTERQLEQIITQKWLAIYPDGWEAYTEYRRTGYPKLYPIIESQNSRVARDEVMRRMTFVSSEYDDNGEATQAAVSLLGGPDENDTRVWWDAK
ncbi:MAG: SusD/RagB family nutrient-binding outer membrane lipoprotein [Rhodothermaceae bacterium]|nr:SusD/RagB family nutrient-binding outer membrane lipoprotein [Rhodothermaceae bacterium]MYG70119.1 SusD/RagB family nutrient-binding outer membrane lipoprotein [Rhodothermaceae bacterium]MYJ45037.1 SusD/RagB family nutrient-binding outer membrane lipoprotein [Rhodothermaceae bacterium]